MVHCSFTCAPQAECILLTLPRTTELLNQSHAPLAHHWTADNQASLQQSLGLVPVLQLLLTQLVPL